MFALIFIFESNDSFFILAEDCKKKWKTLRIQQRRIIIKKIKKNEKRSAIQWNCYDALKFLIPHMDWTATDEIKKDPELDLSILSDMCEDEEHEDCDENYDNDENCESQSESSYDSTMYHETSVSESAAQAADSTNISRTDPMCTVTTTPIQFTTTGTSIADHSNKMNQQYLVAYLPNATTQANPIQIRTDQDLIANQQANCVSINNATVGSAPTMYAAEPAQSTTTGPLDTKYSINSQRIITVPLSTAPPPPTIVNYFLMDIAVQMERLNDIAQMELRIEIQKLILEKLKNMSNLRQTQTSICFTTPQNPNQ